MVLTDFPRDQSPDDISRSQDAISNKRAAEKYAKDLVTLLGQKWYVQTDESARTEGYIFRVVRERKLWSYQLIADFTGDENGVTGRIYPKQVGDIDLVDRTIRYFGSKGIQIGVYD